MLDDVERANPGRRLRLRKEAKSPLRRRPRRRARATWRPPAALSRGFATPRWAAAAQAGGHFQDATHNPGQRSIRGQVFEALRLGPGGPRTRASRSIAGSHPRSLRGSVRAVCIVARIYTGAPSGASGGEYREHVLFLGGLARRLPAAQGIDRPASAGEQEALAMVQPNFPQISAC